MGSHSKVELGTVLAKVSSTDLNFRSDENGHQ